MKGPHMNAMSARPAGRRRDAQEGFVLVAGLLFLLVSSLLGVAMVRGTGLEERIAGNTRDKLRAFSVAQSTLQLGERWLADGGAGTGGPCGDVAVAGATDALRVCADALPDPAALPWGTRIDYRPDELAISPAGGLADDGRLNYREPPGLHIAYLGFSADGNAQLYRVSAFAYGGKADTVAVVQSTYEVSSGIKDLGAL
jgi:type IV pilus assembly protein PilX